MKIKLASVMVNDQAHALKFYTEILGFIKKMDVPAGEHRWITVVSPDDPNGEIELLLEPNAYHAAKAYQRAIYRDKIPFTSFFVEDVQKEYERLVKKDVNFHVRPTKMEWGTYAVFDDTCGNLIQLLQG